MSRNMPTVHLNPNLEGLGISATVAINDRSNRMLAEGKDVIKLGLGESPFPVPTSVVEALKSSAHEKSYLEVKGLPALREAVADHHVRTFGITRDPADVIIGPGSKELMFVLQLAYHGDLIIPAPSWVSYAPQAKILGRDIHWISTRYENDWLLQADELEQICFDDPDRARLMIINYPSNPTGRTYTSEQLKDLADVARRHRVVVLSDEIYGKLHHDGMHRSIVEHYPEGTIFSGGLSKWCGAGGWRLGLFVFPENLRWLRDAMLTVGSETYTSTSSPIQHAAVAAFRYDDEIEEYLQDERRILKALGATITEMLQAAGVRVKCPQGAFYIFPDFSAFADRFALWGISSSAKMCEKLLEDTGVAILPGSDFGRPDSEFTARLAYVDFDGSKALAGARQLPADQLPGQEFLMRYCGRIIDAAQRITKWLESLPRQ
ncbi:MAG: aminotransferase class I/II-fold pyridoxal phosphate-dependent enzyme [Bacteroidota bacterium]|nr:aminotransferase class I/II-fold pyridoxal phosphate-dependent enzyme [Bacteroidota bacterium]